MAGGASGDHQQAPLPGDEEVVVGRRRVGGRGGRRETLMVMLKV